ncbi:DNA/RNA non-specific endonuclease [Billgrantia diversa]|uniref:DNA/RNA non-specific endonuclease n=1 Tax=Halomonas sp. MCCC 1A13316 TaxID=2733487 RepID=UPI0018A554A4|nr:DNA/RNA non-specific endonuclease [Halomonas sp. MCCC 1A13316]QOR37847.1 DNA/RNA non-specific endonuclease [Halomonas sp. MCCC 1A13316]
MALARSRSRRRRASLPRWRSRVRQFAISLVFVLVGSGLWYTQEQGYRDQLSWMGVPTWESPTPLNVHRVLRNDGFLVGWSDVRVNPLWVSYLLHEVEDPRPGARPDFRQDWRTLWPIGADSYFGSGYDRGHLAPNYAIASVHGRQAQQQSFLMSNITPQRPDLNRRLWQRLEEVVIDHFVPRFGVVQVITGPIFPEAFLDNVANRVGLVEIPEAFYKIVVVPAEEPRALAFIMPQQVRGDEPLDAYLVSIDEVEARTGLDFFPQLPEAAAAMLEGEIVVDGWALEEVARLPARY